MIHEELRCHPASRFADAVAVAVIHEGDAVFEGSKPTEGSSVRPILPTVLVFEVR